MNFNHQPAYYFDFQFVLLFFFFLDFCNEEIHFYHTAVIVVVVIVVFFVMKKPPTPPPRGFSSSRNFKSTIWMRHFYCKASNRSVAMRMYTTAFGIFFSFFLSLSVWICYCLMRACLSFILCIIHIYTWVKFTMRAPKWVSSHVRTTIDRSL